MSFLSDFNQIHITFKAYSLYLLMQLPFWFFAIFLFDKHLMFDYPIYIPVVAAVCFTICSSTFFFGITFAENILKKRDDVYISIWASFRFIAMMSFVIVMTYYDNDNTLSSNKLVRLMIYMSIQCIVFFILTLIGIRKNRKNFDKSITKIDQNIKMIKESIGRIESYKGKEKLQELLKQMIEIKKTDRKDINLRNVENIMIDYNEIISNH